MNDQEQRSILLAKIKILFSLGENVNVSSLVIADSSNVLLNISDTEVMAIMACKKAGIPFPEEQGLYISALENDFHAESFASRFGLLRAFGAKLPEHTVLYRDMVKNRYANTDYIQRGFRLLREIGASLSVDSDLYSLVIRLGQYPDKIQAGFSALQEAGATFPGDKDLYRLVLDNSCYADIVPRVVSLLERINAPLSHHKDFYVKIIPDMDRLGSISLGFNALKALGATLKDDKELYLLMIECADNVQEIIDSITYTNQLGANFLEDKAIYRLLFVTRSPAQYIDSIYYMLKKMGAVYAHDKDLFKLVVQKDNARHAVFCFARFEQEKYTVPTHKPLITKALMHVEYADLIFKWLDKHKIKRPLYEAVLQFFLIQYEDLAKSFYLSEKIMSTMDGYFKENKHFLRFAGKNKILEKLQETMAETLAEHASLSQGPLNKSNETRILEEILGKWCSTDVDEVHLRHDEALGYVLCFNSLPEIYLSHLLKFVNFSHIELTYEQILLLGDKIQMVWKDFSSQSGVDETGLVKQLPKAAQLALSYYICSYGYVNINRLFRGVTLKSDLDYQFNNLSNNMYQLDVAFLMGCLVNWAAAELSRLYVRFQDVVGELKLISRKEDLTQSTNEELGVLEQRNANPIYTASVTSSSVKNEPNNFKMENATIIQFEIGDKYPIVNKDEAEVLIPSGASFHCAYNQTGFFAREVNSPAIVPCGAYWSLTAIAEAYQSYLCKPYQQMNQTVKVDNIIVNRPNHGLAHVYRVMMYIDVVLDYFAHHANELGFKLFCQNISLREREWLRVAAAFRITGRESEISVKDDKELYNQFKMNSVIHMELFLKKYPPNQVDSTMQERMLHVLRWMGNPAYEKATNEADMINNHMDLMERAQRNYLHRILSIAHNLDLPRCFVPNEFNSAMQMCVALSVTSNEQQADYMRMIRYAIDLIRAHGDTLATTISVSGVVEIVNKDYCSPFGKVSTNLRQLQEMTNTVHRPKLTEAYQFCDSSEADTVALGKRMR